MVTDGLQAGFLLDSRWHLLRGEMETTKLPALVALAQVLDAAGTSYAIIGGVALQVHQEELRTTLDVGVAVQELDALPRAELEAAGFRPTGRFSHSENWVGPDGVPVQFTDDPALLPALGRAIQVDLEEAHLRVLDRTDLLHEKLRAGTDPARRRSKRLQELADAQGLLERTPALRSELSDVEQRTLLILAIAAASVTVLFLLDLHGSLEFDQSPANEPDPGRAAKHPSSYAVVP
jgi:hypothetical protein